MARWCPCESGSSVDMLSHFTHFFIIFSYLASLSMAAVVTDGLKGLGINERGILSLFSDIFPIATLLRLLTVHKNEERMK